MRETGIAVTPERMPALISWPLISKLAVQDMAITSRKTRCGARRRIASFMIVAGLCWTTAAMSQAQNVSSERPLFELDESTWALFYDMPSKRFRSIRDAFIRQEFASGKHDLQVSIGFLEIEAGRASAELREPLSENIARLKSINADMDTPSVSTATIDAAFARTHWLLAQHYLTLSVQSRDAGQPKMAGRYLWATAHHLERAVIWSEARIDRSILTALEWTRQAGTDLQNSKNSGRAYRDKPVVKTAKTLKRIGELLDRKVWINTEIESPR